MTAAARTSPERPHAAAERPLTAILAVALGAGLPTAVYRVIQDAGGTDFPKFHAAGRHILETGTRRPDTLLHRYLPSVDVAWVLPALMPRTAAAVAWYLVNVGVWVGLLRSIGRRLLPMTPEADRRLVVLSAALLTIVFTLDHLLLGAFHLLMLWLMLEGLARGLAGRHGSAALLLGLAIWLKLLPLLGAGYLLLKRRWAAAVGAVAVALAVDAGLSAAAYGPRAAWAAHVTWWHSRAVGDLNALLSAPAYIEQQRDRNQSLAAVLRRVLTRTGEAHENPMYRRVSVADLPARQLRSVYYVSAATLAIALLILWRRPAAALGSARQSGEIALVILSTLWFSPIVFSYHPTAALPALAAVLGSRWERSRLSKAALLVWIAATFLLAVPAARACGVTLWASLLLGAATIRATTAAPRPAAAA